MARFIHTADWQIGKPYRRIKDEQKRFKLRQERLTAISRIREVSRKEKSQFVLIAGDLFDSPTPSNSCITEVLEAIGEMNIGGNFHISHSTVLGGAEKIEIFIYGTDSTLKISEDINCTTPQSFNTVKLKLETLKKGTNKWKILKPKKN